MANRLVFSPNLTIGKSKYTEAEYEFKYYTGFAVSQKQKSVISLHEAIKKIHPDLKILEVSTKSLNPLGIKLSAFNLTVYDEEKQMEIPLESAFQSSKVFENGGPYRDLRYVHPRNAKKDERLQNSGALIKFNFQNEDWPLTPRTIFYDWIYINALNKLGVESEILKYDAFTDIEFNHQKSVNCQARSVAIYSAIIQLGITDNVLSGKDEFMKLYSEKPETEQLSFMFK